MSLERVYSFSTSFRQTYLPMFKYFLMVTAQWNLPFEKLKTFLCYGRRNCFFAMRSYSFLALTFDYLRVVTDHLNLLDSFLSPIPRNDFGFISIFPKKIKLWTWNFFAVKTVSMYHFLTLQGPTCPWHFLDRFFYRALFFYSFRNYEYFPKTFKIFEKKNWW